MQLCDVTDPIGLRDRAILEVLYSCGVRRMEMIRLKLYDLHLDRELILVHGKGNKERYVPIGERAIAWLRKYIEEGRPQLAIEPDDMSVFLTAQGEPFSRDHLTWTVRERVVAAKLGKVGSCHLFRHTMATLMHENGASASQPDCVKLELVTGRKRISHPMALKFRSKLLSQSPIHRFVPQFQVEHVLQQEFLVEVWWV
jgi:site-specific recombinase XerD